MTRLYIAGPMTGLPEFNYPAFHAAAAELRALGYEVENPAETDRPAADPWQDFLRDAITKLVRCDGVALLPGHHRSKGARLEQSIAARLDIPIRTLGTWQTRVLEKLVILEPRPTLVATAVSTSSGPPAALSGA